MNKERLIVFLATITTSGQSTALLNAVMEYMNNNGGQDVVVALAPALIRCGLLTTATLPASILTNASVARGQSHSDHGRN